MQVMEAVLRSYARLLAEPSGVAAAAAAKFSTTQDMLKYCSSIVLRASSLVTVLSDDPGVPEVDAQQVLLVCMSLMLAGLSTQQEAMGAHCIFILSVSAQLFAAMQFPAELAPQPLSALLFLIGCCLLRMAEQLQLYVRDPGGHSFGDWVV